MLQLPARRATERVNVWRKLQRYGALAWKNSTYILPHTPGNLEKFRWLTAEIRKYRGDASILKVARIEGYSDRQIMALFNDVANERTEEARYDQTLQDLTGQLEKARVALEGARRVAENTPIQLRAARDSESQARARYQAGLATLVEVADAQRLLVQAETDDALAKLSVWRGLASVAAAQGDLKPFMQLLRSRGDP